MTVVVKIGGAQAVDPIGAIDDIADLTTNDERIVVVHGGSTALDETLERLGISPEYVETPDGVVGRFTNEETMHVFKMVFGQLNTDLVLGLQNRGVNAIGLTGVDGQLFTGPRKDAVRVMENGRKKIRRGDFSGTIDSVNTGLLNLCFEHGYTPVTCPPMFADDGTAVNTDADRASAAVAGAVEGILVSLTDVPGILEDPSDPSTRIDLVDSPESFAHLETVATGFMRRKVMAAEEALVNGAEAVIVADANSTDPIQSALSGNGTRITADAITRDQKSGSD